MNKPDRIIEDARGAAAFLKDQGQHQLADAVLRLIFSRQSARETNRRLHADNLKLRAPTGEQQ